MFCCSGSFVVITKLLLFPTKSLILLYVCSLFVLCLIFVCSLFILCLFSVYFCLFIISYLFFLSLYVNISTCPFGMI